MVRDPTGWVADSANTIPLMSEDATGTICYWLDEALDHAVATLLRWVQKDMKFNPHAAEDAIRRYEAKDFKKVPAFDQLTGMTIRSHFLSYQDKLAAAGSLSGKALEKAKANYYQMLNLDEYFEELADLLAFHQLAAGSLSAGHDNPVVTEPTPTAAPAPKRQASAPKKKGRPKKTFEDAISNQVDKAKLTNVLRHFMEGKTGKDAVQYIYAAKVAGYFIFIPTYPSIVQTFGEICSQGKYSTYTHKTTTDPLTNEDVQHYKDEDVSALIDAIKEALAEG